MADETGLVSVLMPCCGQLEYTRLSVPRVLRHSRPPVELLCIDAGSLDGTADVCAPRITFWVDEVPARRSR